VAPARRGARCRAIGLKTFSGPEADRELIGEDYASACMGAGPLRVKRRPELSGCECPLGARNGHQSELAA
jgi:hypothetical protein